VLKSLISFFNSKKILQNKQHKVVAFLFLTLFVIIGASIFFKLRRQRLSRSTIKPISLKVKQKQIPYARQVIKAAAGGELIVNNLTINFPAEFSHQDITASYRRLNNSTIKVNHQVSDLFELTASKWDENTSQDSQNTQNVIAQNDHGQKISQFDKNLEIRYQLSADDFPNYKGDKTALYNKLAKQNKLALYFFNTDTNQWEKLESKFDPDTQELIAYTNHFTVFVAADEDPNQGVQQATEQSLIIDDSDPEPLFVPGGQTDPDQPEFWGEVGSGYNGNALFTGNSINNTPHNWATWQVESGLTGSVELIASIPLLRGQNLTQGASYVVSHAGGETTVVIDQSAYVGGTVSLGTFEFDGSGAVYLSDVVVEQGAYFLSHIVFDAISFGEGFDENMDLIPPLIEDVKAFTNQGTFIIQAKVTDEGSGVDTVAVYFNGQLYPMSTNGNDIYSVALPYAQNSNLDYYIVATDVAGNEAIWQKGRGYVTRGSFYRNIGYYKGALYTGRVNKYLCSSNPPCEPNGSSSSQFTGDPVNTLNGNLIDRQKLVIMPGRPAIDLHLTYNNQGSRESIFGQNWTHSYNYHLLEMDNADFTGVFVQYPDGKAIVFNGPDLQAEAGYYEKLTKTGDGYELIFPDQSKVKFDAGGEIVRFENANANGLNFEYGEKASYTLLSQLSKITADGGREINFEYNQQGLVEKVNAPKSKTLELSYSEEGDLISLKDGNGGQTQFTYTDHNLTEKISPEGHAYFTNTYDAERRVVQQVAGENFIQNYSYSGEPGTGSQETVVTDAHTNSTTYQFNNDSLLEKIIDARTNTVSFAYTANKEIAVKIDQENNRFEYDYDAQGNLIYEKDPLGFEVTREFNLDFNKPTKEIYKQTDHVTFWEYDEHGNLTKETNAKNDSRDLTYDQSGQLTEATDFNTHKTTFSYNQAGDLISSTDAESNTQEFSYDELGRLITLTNPRQFQYHYSYDANDNLLTLAGPLSFTLNYEFDANNRLIKEIDANNGIIKYSFDNSENLVEFKDQLDHTTQYLYGSMNELTAMISPEEHRSEYQYDVTYNLVALTEATGTDDERMTRFEYNKLGDLIKQIDAEGRVANFTYDPLRRLTKETRNTIFGLPNSEQNVSTEYFYSPTGALTTIKDPNNNSTGYELDELDRVLTITDAENQITRYSYDKQGNVLELTNPRDFLTQYQYDNINRLVKIIDAKLGETDFNYDENSNLAALKDANQITTAYLYNALDRRKERLENAVAGGPANQETNVSTKYAYDLHGNLTSLTNPRGFTTNFTYDEAHRNLAVIDAYQHSAQFNYDKENNVLKIIDRNNHANAYTYDNLNRLVTSTNPEEHHESYSWDKVDNLVEFINKRGKTFTSEYDPLNRIRVATDPYTNTKQYQYDAVGNLLSLTDENEHIDKFEYDKVYRLTKNHDAENNLTTRTYDPNSNLVKLIDAEENDTDYVYDELDRLIEKTNAEDETEKYAYDKTVNLTLKTEADETLHQYNYDPLYRLVQVVNNFKDGVEPKGDSNVKTGYQYDANGNLVQTNDPLNHATRFEFDRLDRLTKEINPLANTWQYSYDFERNVTQRIDANSVTTAYQYYPDDQLAKIQYPSHNVEYSYSETNFPITMLDNLGTTSWGYDDLDRLISQLDPLNKGLNYQYDAVGNLTQLTYPDGRNVAHNYFKNDWLKQTEVKDPASQVASDDQGEEIGTINYQRNKVGFPVEINRSNSSYSKIVYDKVYRPLQVHDNQIDSGDHLISKFNYSYSKVGHITEEIAEYGWRQPSKVTTMYNYDGLHRLTKAETDDQQNTEYVYDAAGNRTILTEHLKQGAETRNYNYNEANQLLAIKIDSPMPPNIVEHVYQYDANGNRIDKLVKDETGVDGGVRYEFDEENRLVVAQDYQGQIVQNKQNPNDAETDLSLKPAASVLAKTTETVTLTPEPTIDLDSLVNPDPSPSPTLVPILNPTENLLASLELSPTLEGEVLEENVEATPTIEALLDEKTTGQDKKEDKQTGKQEGEGGTDAGEGTNGLDNNSEKSNPNKPVINDLAHTNLAYDGNGRRLVKTYYPGASQPGKETQYTFDRLDPIVEYSMWNGQRNNLYRTTNDPTLPGIAQGVDLAFYQDFKSEENPNGTKYFYHYDGEGNIAATSKHKAQSDHSYRYDEYGTILPDNGSGDQHGAGASGWQPPHNAYTLTQKQWDSNTNLYYFGARHYDPETGTWLTQDTYLGELPNPPSLHRYMYNYDSPVNYEDKYGNCGGVCLLIGGSILLDFGLDVKDLDQANQVLNDPNASDVDKEIAMMTVEIIRLSQTIDPGVPLDDIFRYLYLKYYKWKILRQAAETGGKILIKEGAEEALEQAGKKTAKEVTEKAIKEGAGEACEAAVKKGPVIHKGAKTVAEQLALKEAKSMSNDLTKVIMKQDKLADVPRLIENYGSGEWVKMQHVHYSENGPNIVIHWFKNLTTGINVEYKFVY